MEFALPRPAVEFTVFGIPAPKGSKSAFPIRRKGGGLGVAVVEGKTDRQKDWSRRVEEVVQTLAAEGAPMLEGPIVAWVTFWVPKPRSAPKRRRTWPDRKPDLDKLCRAMMDPCSGVLIRDDAQVVEYMCLRKLYADEDLFDQRPRAEVRLWRAEDLEPGEGKEVTIRERPGAAVPVDQVGQTNGQPVGVTPVVGS